MKTQKLSALIAVQLALSGAAYGVSFTFDTVNKDIPDGNPVGVSDTQMIVSDITAIGHLDVRLNILGRGSGGFNGDLYVSLVHDTGFTVLLNRPGRSASDPIGYGDSGLNVTLDDTASGNIHEYRLVLSGTQDTPLTGPLTGVWAPDGRNVDPDTVTDATVPTTSLTSFEGLNPNGAWTLYVADLEYGGLSRLASWSLEIEPQGVAPVPEQIHTGTASLLVFASLVLVDSLRRRRAELG